MMMRSAKAVESGRCEPPNPRRMVVNCGNEPARLVQKRMLELPMKRTASRGGGLERSLASKARISFSNCAGSRLAAASRTIRIERNNAAEQKRNGLGMDRCWQDPSLETIVEMQFREAKGDYD